MTLTSVLFYAVIALLGAIVYKLREQLHYWRRRGIPHDRPHPLFGNLVGVQRTKHFSQFAIEYYRKFRGTGPFCGAYFMMRPVAFVLEPQLAKRILIKDFNMFTDRGIFHNERDDPLTAHLFALDGSKWRRMRQQLSPTFSSGKMKFMYPTLAGVAREFAAVMGELVQASDVLEVKELMSRYTTDVIGTCAFGIQCNSLRDPNAEFRTMGRQIFTQLRHGAALNLFMQTFPLLARKLRMRFINDTTHEFFMRVVRETVTLREEQNIKRNDFIDLLIELKNNASVPLGNGEGVSQLSMEEVAAQCFVFFVAGFETSSTTMSFALYELALNQAIQDRVRAEVNACLDKHEQQLSYECMKDLHYLDQVISETLRKYTIVPMLNRVALERYVVPENPKYVIEKGMKVIIPAIAFHYDPELYPEPELFQPERFSAEMVAKRDSVEWLPFGDGPRNCVGMRFGQMQTRCGLAMLIKNFKFSVCEQTQIPLQIDPKLNLFSAKGGIFLRADKL